MMRFRHSTVIPALMLFLAYAATAYPGPADTPRVWDGEVQVAGALRSIIHQGESGSRISLSSLLPDPNLYALGALADLSGEITVVAGEVHLSYPDGMDAARTEIARESDAGATLLVASSVRSWREVVTDREIGFAEIDAELSRLAAAAGVDLERRFPFLMQGEFHDLQWHVIDGTRLTGGASSHHDHLAAAVKKRLERADATLIGFYSRSDQGVFTHMSSETHIHCILDQLPASGHVDHVTIPAGTTIKFPAVAERPAD